MMSISFTLPPTSGRRCWKIASAKQRICIVALYLEQDDGGKGILNALYEAKRQRPELDVRVLVDLRHRTTWTHWRCGI